MADISVVRFSLATIPTVKFFIITNKYTFLRTSVRLHLQSKTHSIEENLLPLKITTDTTVRLSIDVWKKRCIPICCTCDYQKKKKSRKKKKRKEKEHLKSVTEKVCSGAWDLTTVARGCRMLTLRNRKRHEFRFVTKIKVTDRSLAFFSYIFFDEYFFINFFPNIFHFFKKNFIILY